ncbi:MAG: hypothetical protein JWM33_1231, partial [Caulobacteraceae bacterium]|nr:hypothetical protein [Caulobacteraceae bacterium]
MTLRIGQSLSRVHAVIGILFACMLIATAGCIFALARSEANLATQVLDRLSVAAELADTLAENRVAEAYLIFDDSRPHRDTLAERNASMATGLDTLRDLSRSPTDLAGIDRLQLAWGSYRLDQQQLIPLMDGHRRAAAERLFNGDLQARFDRLDAEADAYVAGVRRQASAQSRHAQRMARLAYLLIAASACGGLLVALWVGRFSRQRIVAPLQKVTASLTALAAGDIDVAVDGDRQDEIGDMVRALEVFRDNARQLAVAHGETQAAHVLAEEMARHDSLTGLPNRRLFAETLAMQVQAGRPFAVLLIDLDRFKPVNDLYGHGAGDRALCALAERLAANVERIGRVARLGGDEFCLVTPLSAGVAEAAAIAALVCSLIEQPIILDVGTVEIGATIGIALWPQDAADPTALLRAADLAMYQAKMSERGTWSFFEPAMDEAVAARALMDTDLRRAIAAGEIHPHYQPLVSIADGGLVGFELLSRWHHPEKGLIGPDLFIPAAEERGLIGDLTYSVLRQGCLDAAAWPPHLRLSLNLSPSQVRDPSLPPRLLAILTETGFAPGRLEVEITENALISDMEMTRAVLGALRNMGVSISLDDFGTGYSSLYHLRELRFDKIKVDRSFVEAIGNGEDSWQIVKAMINLSKSLGMTTTAEGIEDAGQWDLLSDWGCDYG